MWRPAPAWPAGGKRPDTLQAQHGERLDEWIATIREGGEPDFRANNVY